MNKKLLVLVALFSLALLAVPVAAQEDTRCADGYSFDTATDACVPDEQLTDQPKTTPDASDSPENESESGDGSTPIENGETSQNETETSSSTVMADLVVQQPHYVEDGIRQQVRDNSTIYFASGEVIYLGLKEVNQSDVLNYGVDVDAGRLVYDKQSDRYVLDTGGNAGTFGVYWIETTEDGEIRHEAQIKVEQANYAFVPGERYDTLRDRAEFGEYVLDIFEDYADGTEEAAELIEEQVFPLYLFFQKPIAAITGDFIAIFTLLLFRPGGLLAVGVLFFFASLIAYAGYRKSRVSTRQLAEIGELDAAKKKQYVKDMKQMVSMMTYQDLGFADDHAQFLRQTLGENPWTGFEKFRRQLSAEYIISVILRAYEQLGYSLVKQDDGEYEFVEDVEDGISPDDITPELIIDVDWPNIVDTGILTHPDVDRQAMYRDGLPIATEPTDGDLIDKMGIEVSEDGNPYALVETRGDVADIFAQFLAGIASNPDYVDADGVPRAEMDVLNFIYLFVAQGAEKYGLPIWYAREVILAARDRLDAGDRLVDKVDDISGGRR